MNEEVSRVFDLLNFGVRKNGDAGVLAFGFEHGEDVAGGAVTEKVASCLVVVRDARFFDQDDEIGGSVASDGGLGEMRVGGNEVFNAAVKVGEVAASTAGDEDFFAEAIGALEDGDAAAALAGPDSAHQAGRAATEDEC